MTGQPHEPQPYEPPALTKIGMVHEFTLASNKVGRASDMYTPTIPTLVGDIVPASS